MKNLHPSEYKGKEFDTLVDVFGLKRDERLNKLFESATHGDGNEISRILIPHSSSLLAFLCFSNVSKDHPIRILGTEYVDVMFEVKNDVIESPDRYPSNIDVMLIDKSGTQILFLESKYTEYLKSGRAYLANRYRAFYDSLLTSNEDKFRFKASEVRVNHRPDENHPKGYSTIEYCLNNGNKTSEYLEGIKQAFSHLLGIATGPSALQAKHNDNYTVQLLERAEKITFASIVYTCNPEKDNEYFGLYKSVFTNGEIIKKALREAVPHSKNIDKLVIHHELLTYQQLKKENPTWLPDKVKQFYNF